jgi:TolA-binding protein
MNPKVKLALYLVLGIGLAVCIRGFISSARNPDDAPTSPPGTNSVTSTNLAASNAVAATNPGATNIAGGTNAPAVAAPDEGQARKSSQRMGRVMAFGIGGFFALVGLSVLIGYDVSRFFANRFEEFIFNDDLKGVRDPDYEEAEETWKRGDYLGAIQLMRDFYKRNPREAHVALRIAEIYEANLGNYLAAALEYEEVLKRRLPPERWGWAAIHLANLYSGKLNKTDAATQLLHRIVGEYGQTAAAKKARERLGIPEPIAPFEPPADSSPGEAPPPEPPSNLPPGFRPK